MADTTQVTRTTELVTRHLAVERVQGAEFICLCVFHSEHRASMWVNVEKDSFICFSCGEGGALRRVWDQLGVDGGTSAGRPGVRQLLAATAHRLTELRSGPTPATPANRTVPESTLDRFTEHPWWTDPIAHGGRGFTAGTVRRFQLGYDVLNDAATIPIRDVAGTLLGVTLRYLHPGRGQDRYRYPWGFHKSQELFASWRVAEQDTPAVVLVEGALDAINIWQAGYPALAIYGNRLSAAQARLLQQLAVRQVVLAFDDDEGGRTANASAKGLSRRSRSSGYRWLYNREHDLRRSFILRTAHLPHGFADPGELSAPQIARMLDESVPYPAY
jgi:hypothetical protein